MLTASAGCLKIIMGRPQKEHFSAGERATKTKKPATTIVMINDTIEEDHDLENSERAMGSSTLNSISRGDGDSNEWIKLSNIYVLWTIWIYDQRSGSC
jgi:hypothetical protein